MYCQNDKVSDVIAVLAIMKNDYQRSSSYRNLTELRKNAVRFLAENELHAKRYKNLDSAQKTIHDALARRLRPEIKDIKAFDAFADEWLHNGGMQLKDILLRHSVKQTQRQRVDNFFRT